MPDGDIVHERLGRKYQKAYKQICDGQFGGEDLAKEVVPAVWKDIQNGGDEPIHLLQEIAAHWQQIRDTYVFEPIDWQKASMLVDELAQQLYADRRFKTLAVEACKEVLQDIRQRANPSNCYIELLAKYMWNVYAAQFSEKVPLTPSHYQDVSREFVGERLEEMRPYVQKHLLPYVKCVYEENTVYLAHVPHQRSKKKPGYDIDTDVSTLGA